MSATFAGLRRKEECVSAAMQANTVLKRKAEVQNNAAVRFFIDKVSFFFFKAMVVLLTAMSTVSPLLFFLANFF